MAQRPTAENRPVQPLPAPPRERSGGSLWTILGLLIAVALAVLIVSSGLAAA